MKQTLRDCLCHCKGNTCEHFGVCFNAFLHQSVTHPIFLMCWEGNRLNRDYDLLFNRNLK